MEINGFEAGDPTLMLNTKSRSIQCVDIRVISMLPCVDIQVISMLAVWVWKGRAIY